MMWCAGAVAYSLPPYSQNLNAIEHTFSDVKSVLTVNEVDSETAVVTVLLLDCHGWITHCGYT